MNNTSEQNLLGVIGNIGSDSIHRLAVMTVAVADNLGCLHAGLQNKEDVTQRRMEKLAAESAESCAVLMGLVG